jgi:hypothetical protein
VSWEPDDPHRPTRRPPHIKSRDSNHIKRAHDALMNELKHFGEMRETFKQFLIYAWLSETDNRKPSDCVIVEESVSPSIRTWHIAEKAPADERFREQYLEMKKNAERLRQECIQLHNKNATLHQEVANLRRMLEDE